MINKKIFLFFYLGFIMTGFYLAIDYGFSIVDYFTNNERYQEQVEQSIEMTALLFMFAIAVVLIMIYRAVLLNKELKAEEKNKNK